MKAGFKFNRLFQLVHAVKRVIFSGTFEPFTSLKHSVESVHTRRINISANEIGRQGKAGDHHDRAAKTLKNEAQNKHVFNIKYKCAKLIIVAPFLTDLVLFPLSRKCIRDCRKKNKVTKKL